MQGIQAWDEKLFRWINGDLASPWLDPVARVLSGYPGFLPTLVVVAVWLLWRGGPRGLVFVLLLGIALLVANQLLADPMKRWVARPRPYALLPEAILRLGRGNSMGSMPSAHAMNTALIATLCVWYYPRFGRAAVVVALGVGWSRIYNGVHFPSDVAVGIVMGVGIGVLALMLGEKVWRDWVTLWRPRWKKRIPSLLTPGIRWRGDSAGPPVPG